MTLIKPVGDITTIASVGIPDDLHCVGDVLERGRESGGLVAAWAVIVLVNKYVSTGEDLEFGCIGLSANFGQALPGYADGNVDLAGDIGFPDFLVLSANFGKTPAGAASVPEPSSLGLLGFSVLFLGFLRRRRNG